MLSPLLSFKAWGTIAKTITFRTHAHTHQAITIPTHPDPSTIPQEVQRSVFRDAIDWWHFLSPAEQKAYDKPGREHHMSGYAWFIRTYLMNPWPATFISLTDCPNTYASQGGKLVSVKGAEDGLEFIAHPPTDYPQTLKPAIERKVIPGWYAYGSAEHAFIAGQISYIPIFVTKATAYDRIGVSVKGSAAGTADLRIFAWNEGLPGALILSAGTVDTSSGGMKEIAISQTLARGYYFLAIRCSGAPSLYAIDPASPHHPPVDGIISGITTNPLNVIPTVTAAYSDPAPAPTCMTLAQDAAVFLREA